ncbi:MAG TPA: hypothetical protein VFZ97_18850 [Acidimicrobiales bacterium]
MQPNLNGNGSTSLHFGGGAIANIATQDICPLNVADHLAYYYDPVAYALAVTYTAHLYNAIFVDRLHNVPGTTAEPPLKCYVTAICQGMSPKSPR